jgi:hypothetical protein
VEHQTVAEAGARARDARTRSVRLTERGRGALEAGGGLRHPLTEDPARDRVLRRGVRRAVWWRPTEVLPAQAVATSMATGTPLVSTS